MSRNNDRQLLQDMLDYARRAHALVRSVDEATFASSPSLPYAVAYLVQVVGEAASKLSPAARDLMPDLPWIDIIGMRHRLVHSYGQVDYFVVWRTANEDLPPLIARLESLNL
jgi:uncharacterized protein with HEPN domain